MDPATNESCAGRGLKVMAFNVVLRPDRSDVRNCRCSCEQEITVEQLPSVGSSTVAALPGELGELGPRWALIVILGALAPVAFGGHDLGRCARPASGVPS